MPVRVLVSWSWINDIAAKDIVPQANFLFAVIVLLLVSFGGGLLAMIVSTCSRTERAVVTMLPLILIPQMLFSKVAFGSTASWNAATTFGPIAGHVMGDSETPQVTSPARWANLLLSLPMVTRPGTCVLDLYGRRDRKEALLQGGI